MVLPTYAANKAPGEYRNFGAFAALKDDGSVLTWGAGLQTGGDDSSAVADEINAIGAPAVVEIFSSTRAFAALREDGSVITWGGNQFFDGGADSSAVADEIDAEGSPAVMEVFSTTGAFAALREDGSLVTWGIDSPGGDRSSVSTEIDADGTPAVTEVYSTAEAFAALRDDGSVVTWGVDDTYGYKLGGDSTAVAGDIDADGSPAVVDISSTKRAFAALREDGSVVTWGGSGGDSSAVADEIDAVNSPAVTEVFSTGYAFAALREDGSVITWGSPSSGGSPQGAGDEIDAQNSPRVVAIFSTERAFAALRMDGSVVTWGQSGGSDSSSVADQIDGDYAPAVMHVFSAKNAFAALREDGSVVTWGYDLRGGNSYKVRNEIDADGSPAVTNIISSTDAFAALREDGSVVTWGSQNDGGDSSEVADQIDGVGAPAVTQVFSTGSAFAALREDGSVVTWGQFGGNSADVADQLSSGVDTISSPFTLNELRPDAPSQVINQTPIANNDAAVTAAGQTVVIDILANDNDTDADALVIEQVDEAAHGTVSVRADGKVSYTPEADFTGLERFGYAITDGDGGTDTARVEITVNDATDESETGQSPVLEDGEDSGLWDNALEGSADGETIAASEAQVYRTYYGALDRKPDSSGFDWWLEEIESGRKTLTDMAGGFYYSDEFQNNADINDNGSVSDEEFIHHMYEGVFGRSPDQGGLDYWLGQLRSGEQEEAEVLERMTQSDEYVEQTALVVSEFDFMG